MPFGKNFVWGAASSAYQIEGSALADGGGASIWDVFSHTPGKIYENQNGDIACDAYNRYEEDIALMQQLKLGAYRFSISWARVDPLGDGNWNPHALAYYDRVVNTCLSKGIQPYITLYHWELPQALEDKGGWLMRDTAQAFARYAAKIAQHFKGRATHYVVLNEPQCSVFLGYATGAHAPGLMLPTQQLFACWHHLMLAYGLGAKAIRETDETAQISIATTGRLCYPNNNGLETINAAQAESFSITGEDWMFTHSMALDPICFGTYPTCPPSALADCIQAVAAEDLETIHFVPDFISVNIYNGQEVYAKNGIAEYKKRYDGFPRTALKWPVTPEVMHWGMLFLHQRYKLPLYVTENGLSCNDKVYLDGKVHDPDRIDFLHRYLRSLQHAIQDGADIRGYFHWSFTDNFEWNNGYNERFGLVYIDYPTQKRILKDSAFWYAKLIQSNGEGL